MTDRATCAGPDCHKLARPGRTYCSAACFNRSRAAEIDERQLRALYATGLTQLEIGQRLGVCQKTISYALDRFGIPKSRAEQRRAAA